MSKKNLTKLFAFIAVFSWASSFVSTKILLTNNYVTANDLGIIRYFFASILVLIIALVMKLKKPKLKDVPSFFLAGFLGFSAYMFFLNTALLHINPSTSSVINALCPGMTAAIAFFIFKEKISFVGLISLLISFVGILILCLWKSSFSANIGVLYMLGAAILLSCFNITQRLFVKKYTAFEVTAYSMLFGTILLIASSPKTLCIIPDLTLVAIMHFLFMAIFPSIIGYYAWAKAISYCEHTSEVTNFMFLTPVLATIMSLIVMHDLPSLATFVGGFFIMLGMIIFQRDRNKN